MTEDELRARIGEARSLAAHLDEHDGSYGAATYRRLADAVERVLDLCDERIAATSGVIAKYGDPGDEWKAAVTTASLRAALYGTPGTTQETP